MRLAATTSGDLCLEFPSAIYFSFAPSFFFLSFERRTRRTPAANQPVRKGKRSAGRTRKKSGSLCFCVTSSRATADVTSAFFCVDAPPLASLPARRFFLVCRCFSSFLLFFCVIRERNVSVATVISTRLVQLVCLTLCVWFCQLLHETAG